MSSDYELNEHFTTLNDGNDFSSTLIGTQASSLQESSFNQIDVEHFDAQLQNLPKDMYISKLLEMCSDNETMVCYYRNVLCSRAKNNKECPKGNLISRKTTKTGSSAQKYARDCYTLHMFMHGELSGVDQVFDKQKYNGTDVSKINIVELRVVVQSLVERVSDLENSLATSNKTIGSLNSKLQSLRSQCDKLQLDYDNLRAESSSKFSKYDSFYKLSTENFKSVQADIDNINSHQGKIDGELKRLNKVSQSFQSKISSLSPNKSYASAVIQHANNDSPDNSNYSPPYGDNVTSEQVYHVQNSSDKSPNLQRSLTPKKHTESSTVDSIDTDAPARIPEDNGHNNGHGNDRISHSPGTSPVIVLRSDNQTKAKVRLEHTNNAHNTEDCTGNTPEYVTPKRSVKYNGLSCHIIVEDKLRSIRNSDTKHQHKDVFLGVTHKKAARYFLSGILKDSTYDGIKSYVENKGVHVSHLTLFKPKGRYSVRTAKINVSPQCSEIVEAPEFWPEGVYCRKWYSEREWDSICEQRYAQADEDWTYSSDNK